MDFNELHATIPYAKGGKEKVLRYSPYPNIVLAMPGRHALDTNPVGGDFVVMVTDKTFHTVDHQFTHTDIFKDVEAKAVASNSMPQEQMDLDYFMSVYLNLISKNTPLPEKYDWPDHLKHTVEPITFLRAVQCLAVAEHRRYAQYESKFGGRFLPFRFAAGIAQGLWTAADAANLQKRGRPGVEILERTHGVPELIQELMN